MAPRDFEVPSISMPKCKHVCVIACMNVAMYTHVYIRSQLAECRDSAYLISFDLPKRCIWTLMNIYVLEMPKQLSCEGKQ